MKQLVIGLGEIGKPLSDLLSLDCSEVYGRDASESALPDGFDCLHICYPFDANFTDTTISYIHRYSPRLCIVHSTVPPGTTASIAQHTRKQYELAYSPIRGRHRFIHRDLLSYSKFFATIENETACLVRECLGATFGLIEFPSVDGLELAKLLETTYSGLLIAWAQEMERYCNQVHANYLDVAAFFAEISYLPNVAFQPGHIGGHCIMPNLGLLDTVRRSEFVDAILTSNVKRAAQADFDPDERLRPIPMEQLLRRIRCEF